MNNNAADNIFLSRYENLKFISSGAQGSVISAFDTKLRHKVAIKKLDRPFENVIVAKRAYREFVMLKQINHQNIVKLLHAFPSHDNVKELTDVYFVMELMDADLSLLRRTDLSHKQISYLIFQMLSGVSHLHKSGIIHRDLKPSNIGVTERCELKLLDFGLACVQDSPMKTEYVVTRFYRAPEVILEVGYDSKIDVWSMGCIFAELISKRILFKGENYIDQWNKIIQILGSPHENFYKNMTKTTRNYLQSLPHYPPHSWDKILPDSMFPPTFTIEVMLTAPNVRDLISKMLVIDPKNRCSVEEALQHPYVNLWNENSESDSPPSTIESLTLDELGVDEVKQLLFDQINHHFCPNIS